MDTTLDTTTPIHLVIMGVSGCGKTSLAELLHEHTGFPYAEADEFHPTANKDKMARGIPLTDEDRWPWLESLREWMSDHAQKGDSSIVTCSALKHTYRELLSHAEGNVAFIHLDGPMELIAERMQRRTGHFMPTSLLPSQFDTLEPLTANENGITLDISHTPEQLCAAVLDAAEIHHTSGVDK